MKIIHPIIEIVSPVINSQILYQTQHSNFESNDHFSYHEASPRNLSEKEIALYENNKKMLSEDFNEDL